MSERLAELSANTASVVREDLEKSRACVLKAQGLVDGIRTAPVVVNGTKESLKTLSAKLEEVDEMYVKIFAAVTRTYGDPVENGTESPDFMDQAPDAE